MSFADLHVHSSFSDGTMTPSEILSVAQNEDISLLSITDHNVIQGAAELMRLARGTGVQCVSGVELDTLCDGVDFHILGYDFDLSDRTFAGRVSSNRARLDMISEILISRMERDYDNISLRDFKKYTCPNGLGGWPALHYFMEAGITQSLREGFSLYEQYGAGYDCVSFPGIGEACRWIHEAGGIAVLAHPGRVIPNDDTVLFESRLRELVSMGLDGIECFYPSHSDEVTDICLKICGQLGLVVTAGSDSHGSFEHTRIGETKTPAGSLNVPFSGTDPHLPLRR